MWALEEHEMGRGSLFYTFSILLDCYLSYLIGQLGGINFGGSECDFMISTHKHGEAIAVISVSNDHVYVNLLFSSMGKQAKKKAKSVAALIHANVLSEWSKECDLLVMSSLIVTSKYDRLVEIIHLGNGKIYLLDSCDTLLTLAAESDVYASGDFAVNDILRDVLSKSGSCVIHLHPTSLTQQWQRKVYSVLRSLNQRPILESELGFAVIYCSTELYCNPRKHCPDGLYQEVNVSEAFSVNPFQIDSEVLTSQTNELCNTVNGLEVSSSFKKK
ncbi:unnamed protein product [Trichobilharzia regenti]|nr:unnamed protein product [Trichobilharzia regenti]